MVGSISAIWGFIVVGKVNPIFRLTKVVYRDKLKKRFIAVNQTGGLKHGVRTWCNSRKIC